MKPARVCTLALLLSFVVTAVSAQVAITPRISGNELTARIQLAGGIEADLTITFEQVVGLNPTALALSAALVDPGDTSLLARLPSGGLVTIPAVFPVLLRIEPTASSALSFSGVYRLSLYTHNLLFSGALRLYRAPRGGSFQDMTAFLEVGSVRTGGTGGDFSEFLIVADVRGLDGVITGKFDSLQSLLTAHAGSMPPGVHQDLRQRLNQARSLYEGGSIVAAIQAVAGFADEVKRQSGSAIPDVWRANGSLINVAGLLRSSADTLKFSLTVRANSPP